MCLIALEAQKPPAAKPADAPDTEFSAARAMELRRGDRPRATSDGVARGQSAVRNFVARKLAELGLATEIQGPKTHALARAQCRRAVEGAGASRQEGASAVHHYDSVPDAPGAGDNASGVAVVLETLRAIKAGSPLERDVIALIDDGEELGLLGAALFVDEHAWARDVGVVLNFDARGVSGPSYHVRDERPERLADSPVCTRVAETAGHVGEHGRDKDHAQQQQYDVFKRAGLAGLNFAFIGGSEHYHRDFGMRRRIWIGAACSTTGTMRSL